MAMDEFYILKTIEGVRVVRFRQSHILDAMTIEHMASGIKELIDSEQAGRFVLDFESVTYLSSSALGMLIGLQRRVVQRKARMKLSGINPEVMEVFHITKLDTVFDIYKDESAAVEAFRKNA